MVIVTHQKLIQYVALYDENCPHLTFPKKLLWKCTLTIALNFLLLFLLWFPILAAAVALLIAYAAYYISIFFGLLRRLNISRWKYSIFLAFLAAVAYGAAQVVHAAVNLVIS